MPATCGLYLLLQHVVSAKLKEYTKLQSPDLLYYTKPGPLSDGLVAYTHM